MNSRQSGNARGMQNRVNEQMNTNLICRVFLAWVLKSKTNRVDKYYNQRLERRRQQLTAVEHMFKSFATQLDQGLSEPDSSRNASVRNTGRKQRSYRGMSKHEGTDSLPDIHQ